MAFYQGCLERLRKSGPEGAFRLKIAEVAFFQHGYITGWFFSAADVSRSAAVVLAALMKLEGMTLLDAWLRLKRARPRVRPNPGFAKQLVAFELRLHGRNSCVASKRGFHPA